MQRHAVCGGDQIMVITHVYRTLVTTLHAAHSLIQRERARCVMERAGQRTNDSLFQVTRSREAKQAQGVGYSHTDGTRTSLSPRTRLTHGSANEPWWWFESSVRCYSYADGKLEQALVASRIQTLGEWTELGWLR